MTWEEIAQRFGLDHATDKAGHPIEGVEGGYLINDNPRATRRGYQAGRRLWAGLGAWPWWAMEHVDNGDGFAGELVSETWDMWEQRSGAPEGTPLLPQDIRS